MSNNQESRRYILHLSDIHLETLPQGRGYRRRLVLDLTENLKLKELHYLVISGDLTNISTTPEYDAVFELLDGLQEDFKVPAERMIIVPGNHDVNWDQAKKSYRSIPKNQLPSELGEEYIPQPGGKALRRDEERYRKRFDTFAALYKKIRDGETYPTDYSDQAIVYPFPEDRILFLGLNSAWQIDHHFKDRAGINMDALDKALGKMKPGQYDAWLKIAVWHHPVAGKDTMNADFLELLAVKGKGFDIGLHGHIHEAIEGYHKYDTQRGLRIIGGGTFGAPAKEQVTGIPLQYNLLEFDPQNAKLTVRSRKKEKVNGTWSADSRWGNKESPKPYYSFVLKKYRPTKVSNGSMPDKATFSSTASKPYFEITGTRWSAEWCFFEKGEVFAKDRVTFANWTEPNKFEGYGEVTYDDTEYKYSITGEVSRSGIIVLTYKAENYPTEANIGMACVELSSSARELTGYWAGRASFMQNGKKLYTVRGGTLRMQRIKDLSRDAP